ncbi:hypothetical protein ACWKWU_17805 [Chitinophaga lutea]
MRWYNPLAALLCTCAFIAWTAACKKKKDADPGPLQSGRQLMKITDGDRKMERFEYPDQQTVKYFRYPGFGPDTLLQVLEYQNGKVRHIRLPFADDMQLVYHGDSLIRSEVSASNGALKTYTEYTYQDGRLREEKTFYASGEQSAAVQYEYDENGNRVTEIQYDDKEDGIFQKRAIIRYSGFQEYPDPREAFFRQRFALGKKSQPRVYTKALHLGPTGFEEWTDEFIYTFDAAGYPIRKSTISYNPDGNVIGRSDVQYLYHP